MQMCKYIRIKHSLNETKNLTTKFSLFCRVQRPEYIEAREKALSREFRKRMSGNDFDSDEKSIVIEKKGEDADRQNS